jgi:hypothetical protein
MSRQKRYTKRRRSSMKMRGGLVETDRQVLTGLGFTDEQINYLFANNPDMMIEFFQNSINPPPGNPFYTEAQTPDQIIQSLVDINNEYDGNNSEGHTTAEARSIMSELGATNNSFDNSFDNNSNNNLNNADLDISTISAIPGSEQNTLSEESIDNPLELGGKRKSKRRTTNKRKTRKTRKTKTRKHRKRRQRGGAMTTSVDNVLDNDEQEYIDYKKLMSKQ